MRQVDDGGILLTRKDMYDRVWSQAMRKLAPEWGMSDVGLKKLCKRFEIPTPPVGYWAKLEHGKKVRKPPLPKWPEDDDPDFGMIYYPDRIAAGQAAETKPEVEVKEEDIVVPAELTSPHPLIEATEKSLTGAKPDEEGLVHPKAKRTLDIHVSPANVQRALRIMDTLIKAIESRGLSVTLKGEGSRLCTYAEVMDEQIWFVLDEITERVERPKTAEEERRARQYPSLYGNERFFIRVPTGRLCMEIPHGLRSG